MSAADAAPVALAVPSGPVPAVPVPHPGQCRMKMIHFKDPDELVDLVKSAPTPCNALEIRIEYPGPKGAFLSFVNNAKRLFVVVPNMEITLKMLVEVTPQLRILNVYEDCKHLWVWRNRPGGLDWADNREKWVDQLLALLPEARSLRTLVLQIGEFTTEFTWPQGVVLPKLTKVCLARNPTNEGFEKKHQIKRQLAQPTRDFSSRVTSATVYESLLRVHSGQLLDVTLSGQQIPLLDALPLNIPKLNLAYGSCVLASLEVEVTRGDHLQLTFSGGDVLIPGFAKEFAAAWGRGQGSGTSPLRSLSLWWNVPSAEGVSLFLESPSLSGLTKLHVRAYRSPDVYHAVGPALHGLAHLRVLELEPFDSDTLAMLVMLRDIPAEAIPALIVIKIFCHFSEDATSHCSTKQHALICREATLANLVLRAPMSLHILSYCHKGGDRAVSLEPCLLGRHPVSEAESCPGCDEAQKRSFKIHLSELPLPYVCVELDEEGAAVVECAECF